MMAVRRQRRTSLSLRERIRRASRDTGELLRFSVLRLSGIANWRIVRSIAQLQILTRASYVMLLLVPILAGLWPTVRLIVNQHNKHIAEASSTFDRTSKDFSENWKRIAAEIAQKSDARP